MADVELLPLPSGNVAHLIAAQSAEIEALRAEVERLRTDGASAVRWAPGSAYWSEVLVELFGPDARKGIDVLEARWRKEIERAERLAEALRESHGEVLRLRAAMFRVYATAANGGNPTMYIEQMRDEMDKPWSGDKASAALEQESDRE